MRSGAVESPPAGAGGSRTTEEKLRALLAEARHVECGTVDRCSMCERIDAALAEPVVGCASCGDKTYSELLDDNVRVRAERDEARAEVERLRKALAAISLDEYESTSSASEKVHGHARIARKALYGEKP